MALNMNLATPSATPSTIQLAPQNTANPASSLTDRNDWKQFFDPADLPSTEVLVLHDEGARLSTILKNASLDDGRNSWSYADLEKAVQKSKQTWESKERLGGGKAQKLFHSLMQKFDMHSTLFQIIPSSETYSSLIVGAATVLVRASVNHSKSIEELSNALDSISDAIGLCDLDNKLIRSQLVQNAIAKLYIAVFLFFGDAILWYNSSSTKKVLHSLHTDFSERFRKSVTIIKDQAAAVRYATTLGSQAEVRVVRLDVEQLRGELHDARLGLSGELRALAEYMVWQQGENLKQHEITQDLLRAAATMSLSMQNGTVSHLDAPQSAPLALPPPAPSITCGETYDRLAQLVSSYPQRTIHGERATAAPSQTLFDPFLARAINKWLAATSQPLLYLEFLSKDPTSRIDHAAALQTNRALVDAKVPAVMFAQEFNAREPGSEDKECDEGIILTMLSLAKDILQQLPHDCQQSSPVLAALKVESLHKPDFRTACLILEAALQAAPPRQNIVLLGYPALWLADQASMGAFIDVVRKATQGSDAGLRMIIITRRKLHNLIKHLRPDEIASLTAFTGNKAVKAPIIVRSASRE